MDQQACKLQVCKSILIEFALSWSTSLPYPNGKMFAILTFAIIEEMVSILSSTGIQASNYQLEKYFLT